MDEAIKIAKEEIAKVEKPRPWRLSVPRIGNFGDMLVLEIEFEDLAQYDEFWAVWYDRPDNPDFWAKWNPLLVKSATNEIWNLIDR